MELMDNDRGKKKKKDKIKIKKSGIGTALTPEIPREGIGTALTPEIPREGIGTALTPETKELDRDEKQYNFKKLKSEMGVPEKTKSGRNILDLIKESKLIDAKKKKLMEEKK